jgi:Protein of unknown function (DUF1579)
MIEQSTNPFGAPLPSPELRRLEPLVGRWQTTARTEAGVFGPSVPVTSLEEFYWLEGGYFLVQTYETAFGDEPAQKGINYWFYDAADSKFRIIFFSNNGPFTEEGNRYEGEVVDGTLRFTGPARFQYDLDASGQVRKEDDGSVLIRWWLRDEAGQFQPWMVNLFRPMRERVAS